MDSAFCMKFDKLDLNLGPSCVDQLAAGKGNVVVSRQAL